MTGLVRPRAFEGLHGVPEALRVLGDATCLERPCVAVIGTRRASHAGRELAYLIGERLAGEGLTVVSGLATGIDAGAHEGALGIGGATVAVLAQGLLTPVYPRGHTRLAADIARWGGCLVSEYDDDALPEGRRFVERDRIQAALSLAVVLVESPSEGGSFHTLAAAARFGRPRFAVLSERPGFNNLGGRRLVRELGGVHVRTLGELTRYVLDLTAKGQSK